MHFDHVIITTDFSEDSLRAFEFAAYQAKMEDSKVTLLYVIEDWEFPASMFRYISNAIEDYKDDIVQDALERLKTLASTHFHHERVHCQVLLANKSAAEEITNYSLSHKGNLIVMASHGGGSIGALFLGSTVQKVIQLSHCPVFVIPKHDIPSADIAQKEYNEKLLVH